MARVAGRAGSTWFATEFVTGLARRAGDKRSPPDPGRCRDHVRLPDSPPPVAPATILLGWWLFRSGGQRDDVAQGLANLLETQVIALVGHREDAAFQ